jgi:hypothetical protein
MHPARLILALNGLAFAGFGLLFLIWPVAMASHVGLVASTPAAVIDLRATYGGCELGLAALLGFCAVSLGGTAFGLLAATCAFAGFAAGRLIGIVAAGGADTLTWCLLGLELGALLLDLTALRLLKRDSRV